MTGDTNETQGHLRAIRLTPTGAHEEVATGSPIPARDEPGVLWIDCSELTNWDDAADAIEGIELSGLTRPALGHLFEGVEPGSGGPPPTMWPDQAESGKLAAGLGVRFLNASWLRATFSAYPDANPPVLILCKVSFLVGGDWIITHRARGVGATLGTPYANAPVSRADLEREVNLRWNSKLTNAGDVAMLMLRGLAGSYRPAIFTINSRLQNAELSFVRHQADSASSDLDVDEYRRELLAMKWVVGSLTREVGALSRRGSPMERAWFHLRESTDIATETQSLIEEALSGAHRETGAIRVGLDLIAGQRTTELLDLQRTEQAQSTQFERRVNVLAAVLIGPALVGAIFDAMPEILPHCAVARLALMLFLMIAAGALGYWLLKRYDGEGEGEKAS